MTSSRSNTSTSSWLALALALFVGLGAAHAGGRKRLVVLEFDGPKAERFHDDLVKLLKKSHTVIATDKWNGVADDLNAAKVTEKNVKRVAKKLKIDGVIIGKIEKRRDQYIVQLKLRAGATGEIVGNRIDAKADEPRLEGKAAREIKDELMGEVDELEANHGGGDDDSDDKPKHKKPADDDDGDKPKHSKKPADDDSDDKPKHGAFVKKPADDDSDDKPKHGKKPADDDASDDKPKHTKKPADDDSDDKPKHKKPVDEDASNDDKPKHRKHTEDDEEAGHHRKHASSDEGDGDTDGVEAHADVPAMTPEAALSPANRAVDFVIGMSFTARRLTFSSDASLANAPPSYKQTLPVAGGIMDATVYPLAFTHKDTGPLTGLGIEVMYDKVIHINSSKKYIDVTTMAQETANLPTVEQRFSIGGVFRYPVGPVVVGAKLLYSNQQFEVQQTLPNMSPTDIPNVNYSMVEPKAFLKYILNPKMIINVDVGFMLVSSTGAISKESTDGGYGPATVSGYELSGGLDYGLTKNLFVRAEGKLETISFTFKGDPNSLANNRDSDNTTQDVHSAKDLYFGGMGTIGYIY